MISQVQIKRQNTEKESVPEHVHYLFQKRTDMKSGINIKNGNIPTDEEN